MPRLFRGAIAAPSRALALVALMAAIAAVALAAMAVSTNAAAAPFKILFVTPLSGPLSVIGKTEVAGMKAGANIVNSQGGILKQKVELTIRDDAGDGAKATSIALQETAATKYNVISCGSQLAQGLPCAQALRNFKTLQLPPLQDPEFNKLPNIYGVGTLYDPPHEGLLQHLVKKKVKSIAVLAGDSQSGRTGLDTFVRLAKKYRKKIKITKSIYVPVATTDATPYLQQANADNPQALVIVAFTPANSPMLRARKKLGIAKTVYTDWLFTSGNYNALTAEERAGVITQIWGYMVKGHKMTKRKASPSSRRSSTRRSRGRRRSASRPALLVATWFSSLVRQRAWRSRPMAPS